jgi:hypothetical protein
MKILAAASGATTLLKSETFETFNWGSPPDYTLPWNGWYIYNNSADNIWTDYWDAGDVILGTKSMQGNSSGEGISEHEGIRFPVTNKKSYRVQFYSGLEILDITGSPSPNVQYGGLLSWRLDAYPNEYNVDVLDPWWQQASAYSQFKADIQLVAYADDYTVDPTKQGSLEAQLGFTNVIGGLFKDFVTSTGAEDNSVDWNGTVVCRAPGTLLQDTDYWVGVRIDISINSIIVYIDKLNTGQWEVVKTVSSTDRIIQHNITNFRLTEIDNAQSSIWFKLGYDNFNIYLLDTSSLFDFNQVSTTQTVRVTDVLDVDGTVDLMGDQGDHNAENGWATCGNASRTWTDLDFTYTGPVQSWDAFGCFNGSNFYTETPNTWGIFKTFVTLGTEFTVNGTLSWASIGAVDHSNPDRAYIQFDDGDSGDGIIGLDTLTNGYSASDCPANALAVEISYEIDVDYNPCLLGALESAVSISVKLYGRKSNGTITQLASTSNHASYSEIFDDWRIDVIDNKFSFHASIEDPTQSCVQVWKTFLSEIDISNYASAWTKIRGLSIAHDNNPNPATEHPVFQMRVLADYDDEVIDVDGLENSGTNDVIVSAAELGQGYAKFTYFTDDILTNWSALKAHLGKELLVYNDLETEEYFRGFIHRLSYINEYHCEFQAYDKLKVLNGHYNGQNPVLLSRRIGMIYPGAPPTFHDVGTIVAGLNQPYHDSGFGSTYHSKFYSVETESPTEKVIYPRYNTVIDVTGATNKPLGTTYDYEIEVGDFKNLYFHADHRMDRVTYATNWDYMVYEDGGGASDFGVRWGFGVQVNTSEGNSIKKATLHLIHQPRIISGYSFGRHPRLWVYNETLVDWDVFDEWSAGVDLDAVGSGSNSMNPTDNPSLPTTFSFGRVTEHSYDVDVSDYADVQTENSYGFTEYTFSVAMTWGKDANACHKFCKVWMEIEFENAQYVFDGSGKIESSGATSVTLPIDTSGTLEDPYEYGATPGDLLFITTDLDTLFTNVMDSLPNGLVADVETLPEIPVLQDTTYVSTLDFMLQIADMLGGRFWREMDNVIFRTSYEDTGITITEDDIANFREGGMTYELDIDPVRSTLVGIGKSSIHTQTVSSPEYTIGWTELINNKDWTTAKMVIDNLTQLVQYYRDGEERVTLTIIDPPATYNALKPGKVCYLDIDNGNIIDWTGGTFDLYIERVDRTQVSSLEKEVMVIHGRRRRK